MLPLTLPDRQHIPGVWVTFQSLEIHSAIVEWTSLVVEKPPSISSKFSGKYIFNLNLSREWILTILRVLESRAAYTCTLHGRLNWVWASAGFLVSPDSRMAPFEVNQVLLTGKPSPSYRHKVLLTGKSSPSYRQTKSFLQAQSPSYMQIKIGRASCRERV